MKFTPRFNAPALNDPNYIGSAYGGRNHCLVINEKDGSVLPNCVGYAWGRFMEILGSTPNLSTGDAGTWYGYSYDNYERGKKAQVGAVICWSQPGAAGHVAIVEQINTDGSIVISQSGYNWKRFWTETVGSDYHIDGYIFQGFIYNPACSDMQTAYNNFMDVVYKSVGMDSSRLLNATQTKNWNTLFIGYCASQAGVSKILPTRASATDLVTDTINKFGGIWHRGPHLGDNSYKPNVGDIICLVYKNQKTTSEYYTDRVAVVTNVNTVYQKSYLAGQEEPETRYSIQVIEGDETGAVIRNTYNKTNSFITGYLELNWSRMNTSRANSPYIRGSLYDESNDQDDALLREISYIANGNQPLINMTDVRLSVINYTSALASFFEIIGSTVLNNLISDYDGYESQQYLFNNPMTYGGNDSQYLRVNGRVIFNEFVKQGFPASAAIGIMSYMWAESRWNPAAINMDENQLFANRGRGLCQWSLGRAVQFVSAVPDWETNVTAQVDYCIQELKVSYKSLYNYLLSLKNTMSNAIDAAKKFTLVFGAGQPFDWSIEEGEEKFKAWYGESNWNPHTEPAQHMWENNISTISV